MQRRLKVLRLEMHAAEIIVREAVVGRERDGVFEGVPRGFEMMLGPFQKSEILVGVFHPRIKLDRAPVFVGGLIVAAQAGESDAAKIVDERVVRIFVFRFGELTKGILKTIFLQCGEAFLERAGCDG